MSKWTWEALETHRSGSSGDVSKLFRNEIVKAPGLFAAGAPNADATIMAREVIQNSWDAARELHRKCGIESKESPNFEISFEFSSIMGKAKSSFLQALDADGLARRANSVDSSIDLGFARPSVLDQLSSSAPLEILKVVEKGTTGMYGPFSSPTSKMYLAMLSVGYTKKDGPGSGGSYGYGKAGLIRGSAIHSVIAYTCFGKSDLEPKVSRRALGVTYWAPHKTPDDKDFTGFARLGYEDHPGNIVPFENDDADKFADALGIEKRDPNNMQDLGTTFLLLAPTIEPQQLLSAIERNWWPALLDNSFNVQVLVNEKELLVPRPRKNQDLRSFIRGYEIATTAQDNSVENEFKKEFATSTLTDGSNYRVGSLGLVSDPQSWSFSDGVHVENDEFSEREKSLVALIRGPRMVVEYREITSTKPHVRGVFVANEDVDDLLKLTEPKAHDRWQFDGHEENVPSVAVEIAKKIDRLVKNEVMVWRKSLKPKFKNHGRIRLKELEKQMRSLFSGDDIIIEPKPRPISINFEQGLVEVNPAKRTIKVESKIELSLNGNFDFKKSQFAMITVQIEYIYVEEGASGERAELIVSPPTGFSRKDSSRANSYLYEGVLTKSPVSFIFESVPYSSDWTGKVVVQAELAKHSVVLGNGNSNVE